MTAHGTATHNRDSQPTENSLTEAHACSLLHDQGYELVIRFQHVHAAWGGQEWHICLVADLPSLTEEQFLQLLQEALSFKLFSV